MTTAASLGASGDFENRRKRVADRKARVLVQGIEGASMVNRVEIMPEAARLVERLRAQHGPLLFHQSGGCCDGSAPMCYPAGDFRVGPQDVFLGRIAECNFYIGAAQFEYWKHTQLIIDVVPGRGAGFSLEAPEGLRFLTRSRLFTAAESEELEAAGPPSAAV